MDNYNNYRILGEYDYIETDEKGGDEDDRTSRER